MQILRLLLGCVVTDGKNVGAKCIFPFIFNGTEHNGCILETNTDAISFEIDIEIESWCSTEVTPISTIMIWQKNQAFI